MGEYVTVQGETVASSFYPQAISPEKFNRAQAVRGGKRSTGGGDRTRINNLLSGMVRCAVCGGNAGYENKGENRSVVYTRRDGTTTNHKRKLYERLRCDGNRRRRGCTNSSLFDYQIIENAALNAVRNAVISPRHEHPAILSLRENVAEKERQLDLIQGQIGNLVDAIANGGSSAVMQRIQSLEMEFESTSSRVSTLRRIEAIYTALPEQGDDVTAVSRFRVT